jgi:hypothetical protein
MEGFGVEDFREAFCFLEVFGATRRDRTGDLLITNPVFGFLADVG